MGHLTRILAVFAALILSIQGQGQTNFRLSGGEVRFTSEAPLETIEATSGRLKGVVDLGRQTFAFSVEIASFRGFNSDLQREHFNENYLESNQHPRATFSGKLIDRFNPDIDSQVIRAKGMLDIHGIRKERILQIRIERHAGGYRMSGEFGVALADHGIQVPRIVHQKIAEVISVRVSGLMTPGQP